MKFREKLAKKSIDLCIIAGSRLLNLAILIDEKFVRPYEQPDPIAEEKSFRTVASSWKQEVPTAPEGLLPRPTVYSATKNGAGDEIPPVYTGPHPDFVVFKAMFERKFGKDGLCPVTINGAPREYNLTDLWNLVDKIHSTPNKNELADAVYAAIMYTVLHAYGDKSDNAKQVN